jgi:hypothetical protein
MESLRILCGFLMMIISWGKVRNFIALVLFILGDFECLVFNAL